MKGRVVMKLKHLQGSGLLILAMSVAACGGIVDTSAQGRATQGPVRNALIFADKVASGTPSVQDAGEIGTISDAAGNFVLNLPGDYGSYILVSQGGTDNITGKPAMTMMAPSGSANVTPLTTLVALAPASQQAALKAKIEATGVKFDADISVNATPAALLLTKSIESAIETLGKGIDPTGTKLTPAELSKVQQLTLSAIATSAAAEPTLLNTAALKDAIANGITNAVPAI